MREYYITDLPTRAAAAQNLPDGAVERIVSQTGLTITAPGLDNEALRAEIGAGVYWLETFRKVKARETARNNELNRLLARSRTFLDFLKKFDRRHCDDKSLGVIDKGIYDSDIANLIVNIEKLVDWTGRELKEPPLNTFPEGAMGWLVGDFLKGIFERFFERPATGTRDTYNEPISEFHNFAMASIEALGIEKSYRGSYAIETVAAYAKRTKSKASLAPAAVAEEK